MLGAIIGDIVGSRWEFNPTNDYKPEFGIKKLVIKVGNLAIILYLYRCKSNSYKNNRR